MVLEKLIVKPSVATGHIKQDNLRWQSFVKVVKKHRAS